jgi:hypothetical protein
VVRTSLTRINSTLRAGATPLRELPGLSQPLGTALEKLGEVSRDPATDGSMRKLTDLADSSRTAVSLLVPAQVHCDVLSLFTQNFAGVFGELGTGDGPSLGALFLAETGATSENFQNARPSSNVGIDPVPVEDASACQAGNEPWTGKQQLGNPPGPAIHGVRPTAPPPGVRDYARAAGLLTDPAGLR